MARTLFRQTNFKNNIKILQRLYTCISFSWQNRNYNTFNALVIVSLPLLINIVCENYIKVCSYKELLIL